MSDHVMVVTQENQGPRYRLECNAQPMAPCRRRRVDLILESPIDLTQPEYEDAGECGIIPWFEDDPGIIPELTGLARFEIGRFPVKMTWDGDDWEWERVEVPKHGMANDVEYVAKVIADGRMIGASWEQIAGRLLQTDMPGLGYEHREDREAGEKAALGGLTLAEYAGKLQERLEAVGRKPEPPVLVDETNAPRLIAIKNVILRQQPNITVADATALAVSIIEEGL